MRGVGHFVRRSLPGNALVLGAYVALAAVGIGRHALSSPSTVCACAGDAGDPPLFMWALKWWPWAIAHGVNPFFSHAVWAPHGISPATMTSIPVAALALAPVTLLSGPLVAYNVLSILAPALAAFTAYRLCLRLTGRLAPSVAGGYLFGFGSFLIGHSLGHGHLILVFLLPVAVELVVARAQSTISRRRFVVLLSIVIALQVGLSTELLADAVLMGAAMLIMLGWLQRDGWAQLRPLAGEVVLAGAIAALLSAPYLYYALFQDTFPRGPGFGEVLGMDALNPLIPTRTARIGGGAFAGLSVKFAHGDISEATGYLSVPILLAFVLFMVVEWRRLRARMILAAVALAGLVALGSHLYVGGVKTIPLPWALVNGQPLFDYMAPLRYTVFVQLAVAVAVALWLARGGGSPGRVAARWTLIAAGVVLLWPNTPSELWQGRPTTPQFFRTAALYKRQLARNSTALVIPFGARGASMLWQAESDMYFRMAGGYTGQTAPPPFDADPAIKELNGLAAPSATDLRHFLVAYRVSTVLIRPAQDGGWTAVMATLGIHARVSGGMLVYRVPGGL